MKRNVSGIARRNQYLESVRRENPKTLVLDAGDLFQGTPIYNFFKGKPEIESMSLCWYDAMAMGNHDLDDGIKNLRRQSQYAFFPILCANITDPDDLPIFRPFHIFNLYGKRIAVIGLMSELAWEAIFKKHQQELKFHDPIAVANNIVSLLRPHVDLIIGLHHMGVEIDREFPKQVQGVDVIIGGHSHTKIPKAELIKNGNENGLGGTLMQQAYAFGIYVGRIDLVLENGKIKRYSSKLTEINSAWEPHSGDPIATLVDGYATEVEKEMAQVIGESSADMTWTNEGPSSLGSLIADILREKEGAQVSLVNTGGIRADLPKGPITLGKIFEILPFDSDQVVTFQIQGKNIRKIVEQNAKNLGKSRTLQFSGLAYAIKGNKVTTIQIDGRPLDPEQWYKVATVDFVFSAFVEQVNVTPQASVNVKFSHPRDVNETGINLRDLVIDYIKEHKIIRPPSDVRLVREN